MDQHATQPLSIAGRVVEKEWTAEGGAVIRAALRRPVFSGSGRGGKRLERYYAALEAQCLHRAEQVLLPRAAALGSAAAWELALDYEVTLHTDERLSLLWTVTERTGLPRPAVLCMGDTRSLPDGRSLSLWDCLAAEKRPSVRSLRRAAAEQCRQRLAEGYTLLLPDWEKKLRRHFSTRRFYLDRTGIRFFFPPETIAPYIEGVLSFPLSL